MYSVVYFTTVILLGTLADLSGRSQTIGNQHADLTMTIV